MELRKCPNATLPAKVRARISQGKLALPLRFPGVKCYGKQRQVHLCFPGMDMAAGRGAPRATGMEALSHHFRQEGDDGGEPGKDYKVNQEHEQIGHDLGCNLVNRNAGDRGDHKEVEADRRGDAANGQVDDHEHAKEHRVNAHAQRHRQKNRRENDDSGRGVDQGSDKEQQNVDQHQEDEGICRDVRETLGQHVRNLGIG